MRATASIDADVRLSEIASRWPTIGLALCVVRDGSPPTFHTAGWADTTARMPVTPDTVFRIGSITKTVTAVAVMQLREQGLVDLDVPVDRYLAGFRLVPADPAWRPPTLRHLLTHTAGAPKLVRPVRALRSGWFGESVPMGQPVPSLAAFYEDGLPLVSEPGEVFNYSDHHFATLGQVVEDVSGVPLDVYFREHVFTPAGMVDTDLLRVERVSDRRATGHRIGRRGPIPVDDRTWVTAAASNVSSTPRDMARYAAMLLARGRGEHGRVLAPESVAAMFAPHHRPDPHLSGVGLGFFRDDLGGHPAVEHQGILPGFNTQLFLAPHDGIGVVAFTNGARNAVTWLLAETAGFVRDLVGAAPDVVRTDVPHRPEVWPELCGWYVPVAQRSDMQARSMLGAGVQVAVRHGRLWVRALSPMPTILRGFALHPDDPDDPYVFRIDLSRHGIGTGRIVFGRDPDTATVHLHLDGVVPLRARKRSGNGTGP